VTKVEVGGDVAGRLLVERIKMK